MRTSAVSDDLMGRRAGVSPMMALNVDAARIPCPMHTGNLLRLALNNDPAEGHLAVEDCAMAPNDTRAPIW